MNQAEKPRVGRAAVRAYRSPAPHTLHRTLPRCLQHGLSYGMNQLQPIGKAYLQAGDVHLQAGDLNLHSGVLYLQPGDIPPLWTEASCPTGCAQPALGPGSAHHRSAARRGQAARKSGRGRPFIERKAVTLGEI